MSLSIAQAKAIPARKLVEDLGGRYAKTDNHGDEWYYSPFRPDKKTPSFKVNLETNTWHDFGLSGTFGHRVQGSGGDNVDLWCDYHQLDRKLNVKEALQAMSQRYSSHDFPLSTMSPATRAANKNILISLPRYKILKIADRIAFSGLKNELIRRRISLPLAQLYLKQGDILDTVTGKTYTGFLFENDKGGYEISVPNPKRNTCFKTCIGPKASTRIMSHDDDADSADVFEGFWDFLSWLEMKGIQWVKNHSYVLNSVSMYSEVCNKIIAFKDTVKNIFLFMDNDEAGYQTTHAIAEHLEEEGFLIGSQEQLYKDHKDLSDFRMQKPKIDY